jgi:hypothetical protein
MGNCTFLVTIKLRRKGGRTKSQDFCVGMRNAESLIEVAETRPM